MIKRIENPEDFAFALRWQTKHAVSVSDLSRAAGVSRQQVYNILKGECANPRLETLLAICAASRLSLVVTTTPAYYESFG